MMRYVLIVFLMIGMSGCAAQNTQSNKDQNVLLQKYNERCAELSKKIDLLKKQHVLSEVNTNEDRKKTHRLMLLLNKLQKLVVSVDAKVEFDRFELRKLRRLVESSKKKK